MFRKLKVSRILLAVFALFAIMTAPIAFSQNSFATSTCGTKTSKVTTYFNWGCSGSQNPIQDVLKTMVGWLSAGVGLAVLGGIIYGAILYVTASGNSSQAQKAMGTIRNSIVALILYFSMYSILSWLVPGGVPALGITGGGGLIGLPNHITDNVTWSGSPFTNIAIPIALNLIDIAFYVIGILSIGFIIWGGFQYLTSGGDSTKATNGRKTITNAIIGVVVAIVGRTIITSVSTALKSGFISSTGSGSTKLPNWTVNIGTILNQVYIIAGILAVIMIIWAGLQYILSNGDSGKTATARKNITYSLVGLVIIILAYAITNFLTSNITHTGSLQGVAGDITTAAFFAVGILAVIMIIVSGLRYVTSAGNAQRASSARNSLVYSLVGLVVAMVAYALVSFVVTAIK